MHASTPTAPNRPRAPPAGTSQRGPQHVLRQPTDPGPIIRSEHHPGVDRVPVVRARRRDDATPAARLSEIGHDYRELRRAVGAHDVMAGLPTELADRLQVSHLPEWARLPGPTERKMIASALVDNAWTVRELRDAVTQVLRGEWPDADPSEDGLQPAPPAPTAKRVVTGHVLNGLERTQEEVAGSLRALREKGRANLTELQAARLKQVCDTIEAQARDARAWLDDATVAGTAEA